MRRQKPGIRLNKPTQTPTTLSMFRGGVFLPYSQIPNGPNRKENVMKNKWGKVTLRRGLLCQTHINLIDKILLNAEKIVINPKTNQIAVLYVGGRITRNQEWLEKKLDDMMTTVIEIETEKFRIRGALITEETVSKVQIPGRYLPREEGEEQGAPVFYRQLVFSRSFSAIFGVDIGIDYLQLAEKVLTLKYAETQAFVRFCLTHDKVNMEMENVLMALGSLREKTSERARRKIKKKIRDEKERLEKDFGITIRKMENGREGIFYQKHPKVYFTPIEQDPKPLSGIQNLKFDFTSMTYGYV